MNENQVLVAGANGFLGRAILSRLLTSGFFVRATDLGAASGTSGIVYQKADITRPEELTPRANAFGNSLTSKNV